LMGWISDISSVTASIFVLVVSIDFILLVSLSQLIDKNQQPATRLASWS
jgi:hypothetical protein